MSYYHKPRPNPLVNRKLYEFLDEHATKTPDKDFMVIYDEEGKRSSMTFKEFSQQSRQLASGLIRQGLGRGDKVVICAPNSYEFAVSWLAVSRIGACAFLSCHDDLNEGRESLLKKLKCEGIICGLNVSPDQKPRVLEVIAKLVEMKDPDGKQFVKAVVLAGADGKSEIQHCNISVYETLLTQEYQAGVLDEAQKQVQCEDLCFSLMSTGTTGPPKPVGYTHHAIVNAINLDVPGGYEQDSVTFSGWPMSWGSEAPSFAAAVVIGFTFVTAPFSKITPDDSYHFMLKVIQDEKCDDLCIPQHDVPKMIAEKFQEKYDLSSVEGLGYGGQIVPRKIIRSLLDIFPDIFAVLVYASVEVFTVGIQPLSKANINSEDYGKMFILPDIEVKVVGEDGVVVPYGERGVIYIRGAKVFSEYIGDSEATAAIKSKTGWVNTRDYGIMYEGGKLRVLGREGDMIHRGDEKLFPGGFEDILMEHQDIEDAVIVGVPDKVLKEELCACIFEVPGSDLKSRVSELEDWCRERFGAENVRPKHFVFMDQFPLVSDSKIDRHAIQNLAKTKLDLVH